MTSNTKNEFHKALEGYSKNTGASNVIKSINNKFGSDIKRLGKKEIISLPSLSNWYKIEKEATSHPKNWWQVVAVAHALGLNSVQTDDLLQHVHPLQGRSIEIILKECPEPEKQWLFLLCKWEPSTCLSLEIKDNADNNEGDEVTEHYSVPPELPSNANFKKRVILTSLGAFFLIITCSILAFNIINDGIEETPLWPYLAQLLPTSTPVATYTPYPPNTPYPTRVPLSTYTPYPPNTPYSTYTPYPTYTPTPTPMRQYSSVIDRNFGSYFTEYSGGVLLASQERGVRVHICYYDADLSSRYLVHKRPCPDALLGWMPKDSLDIPDDWPDLIQLVTLTPTPALP